MKAVRVRITTHEETGEAWYVYGEYSSSAFRSYDDDANIVHNFEFTEKDVNWSTDWSFACGRISEVGQPYRPYVDMVLLRHNRRAVTEYSPDEVPFNILVKRDGFACIKGAEYDMLFFDKE